MQQPALSDLAGDDLVDEPAACRIIGGENTPIHRSTLYRGIRDGRYPAPLKMGPSTNRWSRRELVSVRVKAAAARTNVDAA